MEKNCVELKAYAKINLTLDVLQKRADGYHDLWSIMHGVDLYDDVRVERADGISISCTKPLPDDSAAYRAARAVMALTGEGAHIHIEHRIPDEAGMGAASANAAAVLLGMHELYGSLSLERVYKLGSMIGADVPFCIMRGCALAEGIGDMLTPLSRLPMTLLIVKPARGVSTRALFESLPLPVKHPNTNAALEALRAADVRAMAEVMENALEPRAIEMVPEIAAIKARLLAAGAWGASMTGSGSAVAAIFENDERAEKARRLFPDCGFARVCHTI